MNYEDQGLFGNCEKIFHYKNQLVMQEASIYELVPQLT